MKVINLEKEIFEKACSLCESSFSNEQIFDILKNSSDVEKQIAILKIEEVENEEYANLLVSHLTGQDGPIREVSSIKINELLKQNKNKLFDNEKYYSIYADAVCDVNPNVSRTVIDFLVVLENQQKIFNLLLEKIENIFKRIEKPDKEQKNFLTVRLFNLYWCLEAIGELLAKNKIEVDDVGFVSLLEKSLVFNNYTIDEKVAKIFVLNDYNFKNYVDLKNKLTQSQNFYVKRYFEG